VTADEEERASPDLEPVVAAIDERLAAGDAEGWGDTAEGQMYLQSLTAALVPLAGLDTEETLGNARTFLANFPPVSLPFGDVDERAARWLAQLHDSAEIRASLRELLARTGATWEPRFPLAAAQLAAWGSGPLPPDPTEDAPWMRALVALVRTQLV
jgi:hypothetical protein